MIKPPPNQQAIQGEHSITVHWQHFFSDVFDAILAQQGSGETANRPTRKLYVGRPYFDTTLGLPIWYDGSGWVKADGTAA